MNGRHRLTTLREGNDLKGTAWKSITVTHIHLAKEAKIGKLDVMFMTKKLNTRANMVLSEKTFVPELYTIFHYTKAFKDL